MSEPPVMRFDIVCTVWGCPSHMVFLLPVPGTAAEAVKASRMLTYAHGWRMDRVGALCSTHVPNKVGPLLKATT